MLPGRRACAWMVQMDGRRVFGGIRLFVHVWVHVWVQEMANSWEGGRGGEAAEADVSGRSWQRSLRTMREAATKGAVAVGRRQGVFNEPKLVTATIYMCCLRCY